MIEHGFCCDDLECNHITNFKEGERITHTCEKCGGHTSYFLSSLYDDETGEFIKDFRDEELAAREIPPNTPRCPICNSTNLSKLSTFGKVAKVGMFGIFGAGDVGKTWKCNSCGSKF